MNNRKGFATFFIEYGKSFFLKYLFVFYSAITKK